MGWEAATRTINGGPAWAPLPKPANGFGEGHEDGRGPAWAPLPKPAPKVTHTQKLKRLLGRILSSFQITVQPKIEETQARYLALLWRCFYVALTVLVLLGLWYAALIGTHYWKQYQQEDITQLSLDFSTAIATSLDPSSESRVEKIIQAEHPPDRF